MNSPPISAISAKPIFRRKEAMIQGRVAGITSFRKIRRLVAPSERIRFTRLLSIWCVPW
ncbi:hypothetical protein D3C71_1906710 [compost metagenome]